MRYFMQSMKSASNESLAYLPCAIISKDLSFLVTSQNTKYTLSWWVVPWMATTRFNQESPNCILFTLPPDHANNFCDVSCRPRNNGQSLVNDGRDFLHDQWTLQCCRTASLTEIFCHAFELSRCFLSKIYHFD